MAYYSCHLESASWSHSARCLVNQLRASLYRLLTSGSEEAECCTSRRWAGVSDHESGSVCTSGIAWMSAKTTRWTTSLSARACSNCARATRFLPVTLSWPACHRPPGGANNCVSRLAGVFAEVWFGHWSNSPPKSSPLLRISMSRIRNLRLLAFASSSLLHASQTSLPAFGVRARA